MGCLSILTKKLRRVSGDCSLARRFCSTKVRKSEIKSSSFIGRFQVTNEFLLLKNFIFPEFGILDLRTTEPFRSNSRTFFSDLRTFGLTDLRTFRLMRWNQGIPADEFQRNICSYHTLSHSSGKACSSPCPRTDGRSLNSDGLPG